MNSQILTRRAMPVSWSPIAKRVLGVALLVLSSVAIAYEVANEQWLVVLGVIAVIAALAIGIHDWRWSMSGLLLYMPVSGIAIILAYSRTNAAVLIKDVFFVIPAYIGFGLLARRQGWRVPGAPLGAILALAFLIFVESFNPSVPNPLVALIGTKVWLLYIPLLFLGYRLFQSKKELRRLLGMMTAAAMVPAVIGITEAAALYTGHAREVYALYGPAAAAVTQQFGQTNYIGGGFSVRVPSTFSFEAQYFAFLAAMLTVAFAWWRLSGRRVVGAAACAVLLLASFTSGARAAFLMTPLLIVLIIVLDGRVGQGATIALTLVGTLLGAASLFGADPTAVLNAAANIGVSETQSHFVVDVQNALQTAGLGLGTGYSTLSARNAFIGQVDSRLAVETWYAKVILELGVAGLAIVLVLFGQLLARAYNIHRRMTDAGLRAFSSAVIAFLIWNFIYMTKGGWIDIDPINVYFWLFAGMLLRLTALDRDSRLVHVAVEGPRSSGWTVG